MGDYRCFVGFDEVEGARVRLSPPESHHLVSVNRARRGDPVTAFDGRGTEFDCILEDANGRTAVLRVRASRSCRPLPYAVTLAQALPKGKTFDAIVRQATQIGAMRIAPLLTERTEVRLDPKRRDHKDEKWHAAAVEAAKQSGNPFIPEITPVESLASFLENREPYDLKLLAGLVPQARPLCEYLPDAVRGTPEAPCRVAWLVGPEGDFSPEEVEAALAHGFQPVTLGPCVLRVETAALVALSISGYELGRRLGEEGREKEES